LLNVCAVLSAVGGISKSLGQGPSSMSYPSLLLVVISFKCAHVIFYFCFFRCCCGNHDSNLDTPILCATIRYS